MLKFFRSFTGLPTFDSARLRVEPAKIASAVTIGNFEGLHRGHQLLFRLLAERVHSRVKSGDRPPTVCALTFHPHPRRYFATADSSLPESSLSTLRTKACLFEKLGVERLCIQRFNRAFASFSPEEFVLNVLVKGFAASVVVVGDDWRFGQKRTGDADTLRRLGERYGFEVVLAPQYIVEGERVSSSVVRAAVSDGRLSRARELLGHDYVISGRVVQGDRRGRTLGFPTANVRVPGQLLPPFGVYACRVAVESPCADGIRSLEGPFQAMLNIGLRPTFGGDRPTVEAHLFELPRETNLYGKRLIVELVDRIRDEQRFNSAEELKQQLERDRSDALSRLSRPGETSLFDT